MKRHLKVSLTLAALSLTTVALLTGCNSSSDLEGKVDQNHADQQSALRDAIKSAEDNLAAAKTELQNLVASGDEATAQELNKAVTDLNAAIEAAKKLVADGDAATKTELLAKIEEAKLYAIDAASTSLDTAKKELEAAIVRGDLSTAEELNKAVTTLQEAIDSAKTIAADADAALKAELVAAIEAVKKEAAEAVSATIESAVAEVRAAVEAGDAQGALDLEAAVTELSEAIEVAKSFALESDDALKNELLEAINASKLEATEAIANGIDAATKELEAKIAAGNESSVAAIGAAVDNLQLTIQAAEKLATDSDAVLREELMAAITEAQTASTVYVDEAIDVIATLLREEIAAGDAISAEQVATAVEEVNATIEKLKTFATEADVALETKLDEKIAAVKAELAQSFTEAYAKMVEDFDAKLAAGATTSADELAKAVETMNATIEAAKVFATEADAALKVELEAAIDKAANDAVATMKVALDAAVADLEAKVEAGKVAGAEALSTEVDALKALVEAAKTFATDADAALKAELEATIAESQVSIVESMQAVIDAAVADLEAKIEAGKVAGAEALTSEVNALKALVEAAKTFATDADVALKAELEAAITKSTDAAVATMQAALDAAVADLEAKVEAGNVAGAEALASEVDALKALVEAAKVFATDADVALKAELEDTIAAVKNDLVDVMQNAIDMAVADLERKLENATLESATTLESTVADLMAMIDEARTMASDDNKALADEMNMKFEEVEGRIATKLETAISELQKSVEEALALRDATAEDLTSSVAKLNDAIAAAQELAAKADADLKAEIEATIATTKLELMSSVEEKLAALKAEMLEAVANSKTDVEEQISELSKTVDTLNTLYTDADAALKEEMTSMIEEAKSAAIDAAAQALAEAKTELKALIAEGDATGAANLAAAKVELELKIAEIKELCDGLGETGATTEYVDDAISTLQESLTDAIDAVREAGMQLADWNAATEGIFGVEGGFAKLDELYAVYQAKQNTYVNGDFAKVTALYNEYWVRLVRATSVQDITDILAAFDDKASDIRTIPDAIYDALMEVGESVDDVEYDADAEGLAAVRVLLEQAAALNNSEVNAAILAYGEDEVNLQALYESYVDQYNALLRKSNGKGIKDRMDVVTSEAIVWDDGTAVDSIKAVLDTLRADYNTWISDTNNALANVPGFAESYAAFVEAETRYAALVAAKAQATDINNKIEAMTGKVNEFGATIANRDALDALNTSVENWIDLYFSDEYAGEIGDTVNYTMLNHDALATLNDLFDAKVDAFKEEAAKFSSAVDAIGDVTLMSWDEINAALTAYGNFVVSKDLADYNYMFNDQNDTPASYYDKLVGLYAEYRTLKASALADYNTAFEAVDGITVTIYDAEKVQGILNWYNTYGVKDADGNITFDNGEVGTGYILSSSLTVDAADYAAIVELKADYDALVNAKNDEVDAIIEKIDAIGTVTFGRGDYIRSVRAAYVAYVAGTNAPTGFTADQFSVDGTKTGYAITNYEALVEAESELETLERMVSNTKMFITTLEARTGYSDFTDVDDRDSYDRLSKTIQGMIDQFKEANGGSLETAFTDAEIAKVTAARLAVVKYDYTVLVNESVDSNISFVNDHKIPDVDKDVVATAMNAVKTDTANAIDEATDADAIVALKDLAEVKLAEMIKCVQTYDEYRSYVVFDETLDEAAKADVELRMGLSLETTLNRVVASDNIDDVQQHAKFIRSELESLYSIEK